MKWIAAFFVLAVATVALLFATGLFDTENEQLEPGRRGAQNSAGDGSGAGALTRGSGGSGGGEVGERAGAPRYGPTDVDVVGPKAQPKTLTGDLEVRVLLKTTRTPLPEADVWLLDLDTCPEQEWQTAFETNSKREEYIQSRGQRFRTDREGLATVPRVERGVVLARGQGAGGYKKWMGPVTSPFDILLDPDVELRVLVVDGAQLPVGNVPVAICLNDIEVPYSLIIRPSVHPIGLATFTRLSSTLRPRPDGKGYAVTLGFPTKNRLLIPIDPEHLPSEPIKLILPPVGKVRVRALDAEGQRMEENMIIALGRESQDSRSGGMVFRAETTRRTGSGEAYFPVVEVGAPLVIQFSGVARLRDLVVRESGPANAGEETLIEVQWSTAQPAIVGRAVGPDGAPLVNRRGRFRLWANGRAAGGPPLVTDADGRFRMVITSPWELGSERLARLELWPTDGRGAPHEASLDLSYEATPGDTEYGDIAFSAKSVLAAGLVMGAGAPVPSAHVRAEKYVTTKGKGGEVEEAWEPVTDISANTDAEGLFTIYGDAGDEPLRLVVRRRGFIEGYVEGLQPGATGLRVELVEGELELGGEAKEREMGAGVSDMTDGSGK